MDKKKKELILIAAMVPVLAFVIYTNFISPSEEEGKPSGKAVSREVSPAPAQVAHPTGKKTERHLLSLDKDVRRRQEEIARQDWGRDPFNPAPISPEEINRSSNWRVFQLSGIIPSPEGGVAILDGEVIGVGEEHRGYRLIMVEVSRIILEKNGKEFIIKMLEE